MKKRTLLPALALTLAALAACAGDGPTSAAPERASFDGGSFGSGHVVSPPAGSTDTQVDSVGDERGGSYGSGH